MFMSGSSWSNQYDFITDWPAMGHPVRSGQLGPEQTQYTPLQQEIRLAGAGQPYAHAGQGTNRIPDWVEIWD